MTELKTSIVPDNSALSGLLVKNAADVTLATNSNSADIRKGQGSVSANDTHVGYLSEKLAAGAGVSLTENNDGADETLTIKMFTPPVIGRVDADTLVVGASGGSDTQTLIDLATAGNWIGGASLESASELVHVYEVMAAKGTYKLSDKQPQYTAPATANRIADMQVNEAGWDGTAGTGLDATVVTFNNGTTGDAVVVGNYALIYDDAIFTLGRGRGSAAGTALGNLSVAKINAVAAGAASGTITLEAGHEIAINDDDYIIIVDAGALDYRYDGSAWYRHVGAWFNDSGSDLIDLTAQYGSHQRYDRDSYIADEVADYTTTSATFEAVDASDFTLELTTDGGDVMIGFHGTLAQVTGTIQIDVEGDGVLIAGDDGILRLPAAADAPRANVSFTRLLSGVAPGTHIYELQWLISSGTGTMYSGNAGNNDLHPQFWARELR